jgi:hypothetical protein
MLPASVGFLCGLSFDRKWMRYVSLKRQALSQLRIFKTWNTTLIKLPMFYLSYLICLCPSNVRTLIFCLWDSIFIANFTKTNLPTSSGFHILYCTISVFVLIKTVKTKKQTNIISVTHIILFLRSGFKKICGSMLQSVPYTDRTRAHSCNPKHCIWIYLKSP